MADMYYCNQTDQSQSGSLYSAMAPLVACPPPSRQRRSRTMFTDADIRRLEDFFVRDPYPDIYSREQLAGAIGVPEARIQTWFQNKRSRTRRQINNQRLSPRMSPRTPPADNQENLSPTGMPVTSLPATSTLATSTLSTRTLATSQAPVFQLAPPPVGRRSPSSPASDASGKRSSPKLEVVSPRSERDQDDSGVLDLSVKSSDSPKDSPASRQSRSALRPRQSPQGTASDADRPFFTPWASSPTTPIAAARKAAADALAAAAQSPTLVNQYPLPTQFNPHSPFFGFAPSYNHKNGVYYFQPMPSSAFLQHMVPSPGLSPAFSPALAGLTPMSPSDISTPSAALNIPSWSPYLRRDPTTAFVFPDVPLSHTYSATAASHRRGTPPLDQVAPIVVAPTPSVVTSPVSATMSKAEDLSDSPGSDAGSRSSGYSSRDCASPIDVCN